MQGIRFAIFALAGFWCAASSGDVTIRGRVIDASGKPVAGALVFWLRPAPINSYPPSIDGQTDGDGAFQVTLSGGETLKDVQSEAVLIYAEGHGLGVTWVGILSKGSAETAVVVLPAERDTAFRVVDPDGHVLAGELVEPVLYNEGTVSKLPATFVQAIGRITDEAGLVRFPALMRNQLQSVRVMSQTFGPQQLDLRYVQARAETVIPLRAAGRVEVVFDTSAGRMGKCKMLAYTTGSGPADAVVGPNQQGSIQGAYAEFFDDPRGFEIPALASGLLRFQLSGCTGREELLPHWPERTELKAGETKKFTVPFEKTVTIRGRVLLQGKPYSDCDVFVYTRDAGCSILVRPDAKGRYSCNVLQGPVSSYATRRFAPGHPSQQRSNFLEGVADANGFQFGDLTFPGQ